MAFAERRKYPRIDQAVPLKVATAQGEFLVETNNLSCGGVLCWFPESCQPMTKLDISLELPVPDPEHRRIHCLGVVIRQEHRAEQRKTTPYLTAIFFSEISAVDRRRIAEFVLQSMLSHGSRYP